MNKSLADTADKAFETSLQSAAPGRTFAQDFGAQKMEQDMCVLDMPERNVIPAWEACVQNAAEAKNAVEEEVETAKRVNVCRLCVHGDPR